MEITFGRGRRAPAVGAQCRLVQPVYIHCTFWVYIVYILYMYVYILHTSYILCTYRICFIYCVLYISRAPM